MQRFIPIIVIVVLGLCGLAYVYEHTGVRAGASLAAYSRGSQQAHTTGSPTPSSTFTTVPTATATSEATSTAAPSPTPTVVLNLTPPQFSLFTVNPRFTPQNVSFTLSRAAHVWVRIAPEGEVTHVRTLDLHQQPAGIVNLQWDGRDNAGQVVPPGTYSYTIMAKDATGARKSETYNGLGVTDKRIVVSLSQQRLTAYDGTKPFLTVLVTTGNPALPTPLGHYPILGKYSPFTFRSPWPQGSLYYYTPSPVSYALLFDNRGYYIHDAPWRTAYGPGTNATVGKPGQNYTGTHGCVNVPLAVEQELFNWATIGTVVEVVP